jgi:low molecular weight protein-tyrosine phosphatase
MRYVRVASMSEPVRILFVCTGNICRSPMAEGMARALVSRRFPERVGDLTFGSAGVAGLDGEHPTREAIVAMKARGVDISEHVAQSISTGLVAGSDLVLTMEAAQSEHIGLTSASVPVFLLRKLGEAARRALKSADESVEGTPPERLSRLRSFAASIERRAGWELPAFSYEVADPIGRPFDEYVRAADTMEKPIADILFFTLGSDTLM